MIDLCADEHSFYFNPYSGELSLEFPRSRTNSRGGILAVSFTYKSISDF